MQTIASLLQHGSRDQGMLEREVLLAHVLSTTRSDLHAHPERCVSSEQKNLFSQLMTRYDKGEPVAYLIGFQEFWSLHLRVTRDTLIPRPETELLVECILEQAATSVPAQNHPYVVADLGTGSGAIALALAHEKPDWTIYATDHSHAALLVAADNARRLGSDTVQFLEGNWCDALPHIGFDFIVSNPPYIAKEDPHLQKSVLDYEPHHAFLSAGSGLSDIEHIIQSARSYLKPGGCLLLEHGFQQAEAIRRRFLEAGYSDIQTRRDLSGLERVTLGFKV